MKKKLIISACIISLIALIAGCIFLVAKLNSRKPDRTSWNYYDRCLYIRADDWQQIVTDSEFKLNIAEENGEIKSVEYGTYPAINSIFDISALEEEFARQHLLMSDDDVIGFCSGIDFNRFDLLNSYISDLKEGGKVPLRFYQSISTDYEHKSIDMFIFPTDATQNIQDDSTLRYEVIAYTPLVFIVDSKNPIDSLTTEQIVNIYSGKVRNFKSVGGSNSVITTYQRCDITYAQQMMKMIMKDSSMVSPRMVHDTSFVGGIPSVTEEYQNSKGSIGYVLRHFADKLYGDDVKYLKIDGVAPTNENVQNGTYPYYAVVCAAVRADDEESVGNRFLDWILSEEGQKCVEMAGFVPLATD